MTDEQATDDEAQEKSHASHRSKGCARNFRTEAALTLTPDYEPLTRGMRAAVPHTDPLRGGREIQAGHLCSGRDVDIPDDLEAIRDEARAVI
ncbi:MAG: hypothetical protein M3016_09215 [Actinomycetota bacterium]|nr:hypothetical protein [Actinomycetota bacterium]